MSGPGGGGSTRYFLFARIREGSAIRGRIWDADPQTHQMTPVTRYQGRYGDARMQELYKQGVQLVEVDQRFRKDES